MGDEMAAKRDSSSDELEAFYTAVDAQARDLADRHGERLRCGRGCASCCTDDLSVLEVEARRIRERHGELLRNASPHPPGACAFLDGDQSCRIYPDRPYICRTQGLPFRWFEEVATDAQKEGGEVLERRDICPLNVDGEPALEDLPEAECWLLGPAEGRLQEIQQSAGLDTAERVPLRSLFVCS